MDPHFPRQIIMKQPNTHNGFLSGEGNALGLKMTWHDDVERGVVYCETSVPRVFSSYPGVVHGGMVSTLLDETAVRAVMLEEGHDCIMVTARLDVHYKKPTPPETPLRVEGRIIKNSRTKAVTEASIILPDGTVSAVGTAIIVLPKMSPLSTSPEDMAAWQRTMHPKAKKMKK